MKTKEQVLKHLMEFGYTRKAIDRIMGFLLGQGLKTPDETITYLKGDLPFEDFYKWYNSKEVKKSKLEAYKEIADFLKNNVKDAPLYWLEYLNNDIKMLDILSNPYHSKLNKEYLDELDKQTKKIASDLVDSFKGLEIFFRK